MLRGIDISHWQQFIDIKKVFCDFAIVKATEGTTYVDPCCDRFFQDAKSVGKRLGFYHFARNDRNSAEAEAHFFYERTKAYFGHGIPVLDWESKVVSDVAWAKRWLDEVYRLSGVRPMIYTSQSVVLSYDWSSVAKDYPLWLAKYPVGVTSFPMAERFHPAIKHWSQMAMWQFTSRGRLNGYNGYLDLDLFYGDPAEWDRLVGGIKADTGIDHLTDQELADKVLAGEFGDGDARKEALGSRYDAVQKIINDRLLAKPEKIKVGDWVKVIKNINYDTGKRFRLYHDIYAVMALKGKRAVIGHKGKVTSAISVDNLRKV